MLRSMYSGISGMKNFQTKLDVIGNNIANVNTAGFKKGRATFQEMMAQTTHGAQGPTATKGGVNPAQVGLGSQMGSIDNIHTQGFRQTTNRPLDLSLEGDGMFVVASGTGVDANQTTYDPDESTPTSVQMDADNVSLAYTRAGNFYLDDNGNIVNSSGQFLLGFGQDGTTPATINIPDTAQSFSVQTDGTVNYIDKSGETKIAGQVALANFSNPGGLQKDGGSLYTNTQNAGGTDLDNNGIPDLLTPESDGVASLVSGALEMSNVDLAEEFTEMIVAQRGFQANTRIITTSDEILQELVNLKR